MIYQSAIPSWTLENKSVFLRADLNVPLNNGTIEDEFKLQALIPTLDLILDKKGKIILATHIGRPTHAQPELSTQHLLPWFLYKGYSVVFCPTLEKAYEESKQNTQTIVLLENLRFYPGEKSEDTEFAQQLKKLAQYYVNDAFGTLHRTDSSVVALPQLFSINQKTFGLLIQKELNNAQKLLTPKHPFCVIIGGGKASDKIPLIKALSSKIDHLLLCPGIDREFTQIAADIQSLPIELPEDYIVGKSLTQGPFIVKKRSELRSQDFTVCIGPGTQKKYAELITQCKTVFYNGLMGTLENLETLAGVYALFTAMQHCEYALIGGGDSTAAARKLGFDKSLNLSTGGGALLAYLSNKKLPALEELIDRTKT